MKLNIFEGARRISMLIGGVWAIGFIGNAIFSSTYVSLSYAVQSLGMKPVLVDDCSSEDAKEYITTQTRNGDSVSINLCFTPQRADNGKMLIAYAPADGGKMWMAENYSTEVSNYTKSVAQAFKLDDKGIKEVQQRKKDALLERWKESMQLLFGGLAAGWVLISAIGWIVRGFLGVPQGKDKQPSE